MPNVANDNAFDGSHAFELIMVRPPYEMLVCVDARRQAFRWLGVAVPGC